LKVFDLGGSDENGEIFYFYHLNRRGVFVYYIRLKIIFRS